MAGSHQRLCQTTTSSLSTQQGQAFDWHWQQSSGQAEKFAFGTEKPCIAREQNAAILAARSDQVSKGCNMLTPYASSYGQAWADNHRIRHAYKHSRVID